MVITNWEGPAGPDMILVNQTRDLYPQMESSLDTSVGVRCTISILHLARPNR